MDNDKIAALIWSGDVRRSTEGRQPLLAGILTGLLNKPIVSLAVTAGLTQPLVLADNEQLLPGVPVGDILEEELDISVSPGSIVVFEPADFADRPNSSMHEFGRVLETVLTDLDDGGTDEPAAAPDRIETAIAKNAALDRRPAMPFQARPAQSDRSAGAFRRPVAQL